LLLKEICQKRKYGWKWLPKERARMKSILLLRSADWRKEKKNLLRKSVLRIGDGKKKKRLIRLTKLRKIAKTWIAMLLMESFYRKKDQWKRLLRKNRSKEIRIVAEKEAKEKQLEAEQNFASKRRMKEERRAADEKAAKGKQIEQERIYVERKCFEEK
jgi:hypothetical protein